MDAQSMPLVVREHEVPTAAAVDTVRQCPIERLYDDLLIAIFDVARCRPPSECDYDEQDTTLEVISHVSQHWRRLVIGVPYFWTDLVIKLEKPVSRLAAYLERSQQCLLDVTLQSCCAVSAEKTQALLDMLSNHKHRWRQFVLKPHEETDTDLIAFYLSDNCSFSRIDSLRLFLPYHPPLESAQPPWPWFSSCSGLNTLELYIHRQQAHPTIPQFRNLVSSSPFLQNLTLVGEVFDLSPDHGHSVIEIPSLKSLSIGTGSVENNYFGLLLDLLSTPALEAMELWWLDDDGWNIFRKSVDVSPSAYSKLKSLALAEVEFGEDEIGNWMESAFPMLQHLTLLEGELEDDRHDCYNDIVARFLHLLHCPPPSPQHSQIPTHSQRPVWPDFRMLTISYTRDHELLRDMLISRAAVGRPISTLQFDPDISFHLSIDSATCEAIRALVHVEDFCKELVYPWNTQPRHWIYQMNTTC